MNMADNNLQAKVISFEQALKEESKQPVLKKESKQAGQKQRAIQNEAYSDREDDYGVEYPKGQRLNNQVKAVNEQSEQEEEYNRFKHVSQREKGFSWPEDPMDLSSQELLNRERYQQEQNAESRVIIEQSRLELNDALEDRDELMAQVANKREISDRLEEQTRLLEGQQNDLIQHIKSQIDSFQRNKQKDVQTLEQKLQSKTDLVGRFTQKHKNQLQKCQQMKSKFTNIKKELNQLKGDLAVHNKKSDEMVETVRKQFGGQLSSLLREISQTEKQLEEVKLEYYKLMSMEYQSKLDRSKEKCAEAEQLIEDTKQEIVNEEYETNTMIIGRRNMKVANEAIVITLERVNTLQLQNESLFSQLSQTKQESQELLQLLTHEKNLQPFELQEEIQTIKASLDRNLSSRFKQQLLDQQSLLQTQLQSCLQDEKNLTAELENLLIFISEPIDQIKPDIKNHNNETKLRLAICGWIFLLMIIVYRVMI